MVRTTIALGGRKVGLSRNERLILEALTVHRPLRFEIAAQALGYDEFDEYAKANVRVVVCRLREKLKLTGVGVAAVRAVGYQLARVEA